MGGRGKPNNDTKKQDCSIFLPKRHLEMHIVWQEFLFFKLDFSPKPQNTENA